MSRGFRVSNGTPTTDRIYFSVAVDLSTRCWVWLNCVNADGYGGITVGLRHQYAHRASYEAFVGPIPDGLQIDHLCRNRACVNPEHLEPVTPSVNVTRSEHHERVKTHCKHGHEFTPENTGWRFQKDGVSLTRKCRACTRANVAGCRRRARLAVEREAQQLTEAA